MSKMPAVCLCAAVSGKYQKWLLIKVWRLRLFYIVNMCAACFNNRDVCGMK